MNVEVQQQCFYNDAITHLQNEINFLSDLLPFLNIVKDVSSTYDDSNNEVNHLTKKDLCDISNKINSAKSQCEFLNEEIQKCTDAEISPNYLQLIIKDLTLKRDCFNKCLKKGVLCNFKELSEDNIKSIDEDSLKQLIKSLSQELGQYLSKVSRLKIFGHIKRISKNIVMVGANGSGKSSYSRSIKKVRGENITIISAQKVFHFDRIQSLPIGGTTIDSVHAFQNNDKLGRDHNMLSLLVNDFKQVMLALLENYNFNAHALYGSYKNNAKAQRRPSVLERVIDIWEEIYPHRKLKYVNGNIEVLPVSGGKPYSFLGLSDGEKAVFYYVAHVLLAKINNYSLL